MRRSNLHFRTFVTTPPLKAYQKLYKAHNFALRFNRSTVKMGREDQQEEREVLDSIFPDEITGETQTIAFSIFSN